MHTRTHVRTQKHAHTHTHARIHNNISPTCDTLNLHLFPLCQLVVTFFVCRIVLYPLICLRTTLFEAEEIVAAQGITYGWWEKPLFNGLLITLFVLQIYWFGQVCARVCMRLCMCICACMCARGCV